MLMLMSVAVHADGDADGDAAAALVSRCCCRRCCKAHRNGSKKLSRDNEQFLTKESVDGS